MSDLEETEVIDSSLAEDVSSIPETPNTSVSQQISSDDEAIPLRKTKPVPAVDSSDEDQPIAVNRPRKNYNIPSTDEEEASESTVHSPDEQSLQDLEEECERKIEKYRLSPKTRRSMGVFRQPSDSESESEEESNEFDEKEFEVRDGFSSTMMVPRGAELLSVSTDKEDSGDSVVLIDAKVPTIDLLDESPETTAVVFPTPPVKTERMSQGKALVQPKITNFGKVSVPRDVYEEQKQRLDQMVQMVSQQENLYKTVGRTMFDGGEKLLSRLNSLRKDVEEQRKTVEGLQVAPDEAIIDLSHADDEKPRQSNVANGPKHVDWDDLELMLDSEKPKYVGKQGIKTFENQKAVTMDTLKEIHGSLSSRPPETALVDDPKCLKVPLMAHQKNAIAFMLWRESQKPRGGLLADDMGLGKTLTMLSLVVCDLELKKEEQSKGGDNGAPAEEEESEDEDEDDEELEGAENKQPKKKGMAGWSAKGRRDHYPGGTLVVCPASLLQQWEGEVKSKLQRNSLSYLVYHGTKRDSRGRYLSDYDLVVTTYSIASVDKKSNTGLYRVKWRRIILDEGHAIRNHKSQMSMAACDLMGRRRWVLTGTPIHNKEMDMYAVLKFIRCQPFSDLLYFKKWIDNKTSSGKQRLNTLLKSIMLRRTKAELQLKGALQSLPSKTLKVVNVRMDKDEMNIYQRVLTYSRTLFAQFLDQRAEKITGDAGVVRQKVESGRDPNAVYFKLHKKMARMAKGPKQVQQHQILVLLLRLRQVCCHPGLINAMLDDKEMNKGGDGSFTDQSEEEDEDKSEIDLLNQLEKLAINENSQTEDVSAASVDLSGDGDGGGGGRREKIMVATNPLFNVQRPSTKMRVILETVEQLLQSDDKIVIVSQWTSVLNILEQYTNERKIPTTKLTGEVMVKDRGLVVDKFNAKDGPRIMFLSLAAGGVGLNLVTGNHLFLVDLHWNPQLEQQAQDRVYRYGQQKPVTIYKFVTSDSIEERIQALQDHKLQLADAILTGSKCAAGSKLTIADLKMLFDME